MIFSRRLRSEAMMRAKLDPDEDRLPARLPRFLQVVSAADASFCTAFFALFAIVEPRCQTVRTYHASRFATMPSTVSLSAGLSKLSPVASAINSCTIHSRRSQRGARLPAVYRSVSGRDLESAFREDTRYTLRRSLRLACSAATAV